MWDYFSTWVSLIWERRREKSLNQGSNEAICNWNLSKLVSRDHNALKCGNLCAIIHSSRRDNKVSTTFHISPRELKKSGSQKLTFFQRCMLLLLISDSDKNWQKVAISGRSAGTWVGTGKSQHPHHFMINAYLQTCATLISHFDIYTLLIKYPNHKLV